MKLFIVKQTTVNNNEPKHYASHSHTEIKGVYNSKELATDKIDDLYLSSVKFREQHPELYFIDFTAEIEEVMLNAKISKI